MLLHYLEMLPYHNTWLRMEVLDGKPHGNVAWRFQLPWIKMSFSTFDTQFFFFFYQNWTTLNQEIRDPILQQAIRWNPRSYSGLHCRWCSVETHYEGLTIEPSSPFAHTSPYISTRGPYQQPSDYHTKLEGLTKHPQGTCLPNTRALPSTLIFIS